MAELTVLLAAARRGDQAIAGADFGLRYNDLRRLARARLGQHRMVTPLDSTSLVHESYLRPAGAQGQPVADRHHFFANAARVMRSVIVDFACNLLAELRGGGAGLVVLDTELGDTLSATEARVLRVHDQHFL